MPGWSLIRSTKKLRRWRTLAILAIVVGASAPAGAHADTIVLKNGRRIVGESVTREDGKVSCETPAGRITISESLVLRIEKDDLSVAVSSQPNISAANLAIARPLPDEHPGMEPVARETVHDGAIDLAALARFDSAAAGGSSEAVKRAVAAHSAAADFSFARGDLTAALAQSERALAIDPGQVPLLLNVAYLRLRGGEYAGALDLLDRVRRVAPDSADAAKLAGWADYGLNRLPQAVAEWKRAQQLRPDAEVAKALAKAQQELEVESNYLEGESAHFVLRYNGTAAPELARAVLLVLEDDFQSIAQNLEFAPREPIAVILYTSQAFGDITRAPSWVGALNDGRIRIPVQGLVSVTPELARVLKHELTHSFVAEKTHGRCPVWLQEGLAQWMEGKRSGDSAAALVALYDRHDDLSLTVLEGTWMSLPGEVVGQAYAWSLAIVESLEASGPADIERLLERVAVEVTPEGALRSSQHVDYSEVTRATAEYLRSTYLRRP